MGEYTITLEEMERIARSGVRSQKQELFTPARTDAGEAGDLVPVTSARRILNTRMAIGNTTPAWFILHPDHDDRAVGRGADLPARLDLIGAQDLAVAWLWEQFRDLPIPLTAAEVTEQHRHRFRETAAALRDGYQLVLQAFRKVRDEEAAKKKTTRVAEAMRRIEEAGPAPVGPQDEVNVDGAWEGLSLRAAYRRLSSVVDPHRESISIVRIRGALAYSCNGAHAMRLPLALTRDDKLSLADHGNQGMLTSLGIEADATPDGGARLWAMLDDAGRDATWQETIDAGRAAELIEALCDLHRAACGYEDAKFAVVRVGDGRLWLSYLGLRRAAYAPQEGPVHVDLGETRVPPGPLPGGVYGAVSVLLLADALRGASGPLRLIWKQGTWMALFREDGEMSVIAPQKEPPTMDMLRAVERAGAAWW